MEPHELAHLDQLAAAHDASEGLDLYRAALKMLAAARSPEVEQVACDLAYVGALLLARDE